MNEGADQVCDSVEARDWGQVTYREALARQLQLVEERLAGTIGDQLILVEHPPVFTIGRRTGAAKHLLWDETARAKNGIDLVATNRGGDITYHGPGQLVGYPIVDLAASKDLHRYLRSLEAVLIRTLAGFGVSATQREQKTGIWVENRKIAAIGVAVRRWVTYHGFALNVSVNLSHFQGIIPCGIPAEEGLVTSLNAELGENLAIGMVKERIAVEFCREFADTGSNGEQA